MSLKATGMPVSGPAAPLARSASALFAASSARLSSTVMKAFSPPFSRSIRARNWRVSSTEETFFASRAPASSSRVEFSKLLNDFGHEVEVALHCRRDGLIELVLVAFRDFVHAQALADVQGMRHRLDAGDVDRAHLFDEREHAVEALEHLRGFLCRDRDAGQRGNPAHVVVG